MAISFDNLRTGHFYHLKNFGEISEFEVLEIQGQGDFELKDLTSKEVYKLSDLLRYGRGEDFGLFEIQPD